MTRFAENMNRPWSHHLAKVLAIVLTVALAAAPAWGQEETPAEDESVPKPTPALPSIEPSRAPARSPGSLRRPVSPDPAMTAKLRHSLTPADLPRLRRQLAQLLAEVGVPTLDEQTAADQQLDDLAQQSADLANQLPQASSKLQARNLQLNAYNRLAQRAQQRQAPAETARRVEQIRSAAADAKRLPAREADTLGDFWLLQADLIEINRQTADVTQRKRQAADRLERFLEAHPAIASPAQQVEPQAASSAKSTAPQPQPDATGAPSQPAAAPKFANPKFAKSFATDPGVAAHNQIVRDTQIALLRLRDHLGDSAEARKLAQALQQTDDPSLNAWLRQHFNHLELLGRGFEAELMVNQPGRDQAAGGQPWRSRDQRGKLLLLHFAPTNQPHDAEQVAAELEQLRQAWREQAEPGLAILTIVPADRLVNGKGDAKGQGQSQSLNIPWPIYHEGAGQVSLTQVFSVTATPRYVLINPQGRITAIAPTPAAVLKKQ